MKFSIVIVSYNAGDKLNETIQSVLEQTYADYEIIVKDGCSNDRSIENIITDSRINIFVSKDKGIYDAMNQAIEHVRGDYILFLNCGDKLYSNTVLEKVRGAIAAERYGIYYGDNYVRSRDGVVIYPNGLSDYQLMTKTICHQCIFFAKEIFEKEKYDGETYRLAADMALYVKCIKKLGITTRHLPMIVADYESDGTSETNAHRKQIMREKKSILKRYLSRKEYVLGSVMKLVSLKYFKEILATSAWFRGMYERIAIVVLKRRATKYKESVD